MALTSVFYDGPVTETDRAKNRAGTPDYGVYGVNDFKVTAHPSIPFAVLVKAGRAHGHGVTDLAEIDQVVQCPTLSGAGAVRWDLIAVRRDWQPLLGGPSTLVVISAGASPTIPAARKVGPGVQDDQPLFLVKWQGGTSAPVEFVDLRCWAATGGAVIADYRARGYLGKPGASVLLAGVQWHYAPTGNGVWDWVEGYNPNRAPRVEIGQGTRPPVFKSSEKLVKLNAYNVGDIFFDTPFPVKVVSVGLERRHTTAGAVGFTIIAAGTNTARVQFTATGVPANSSIYVTYQAWGY